MQMQRYFQWYEDYFWHWEEEGEVLAVYSGNTIAYKDLIVEVLERLSDQGLPPFGSLLLAILATNPDGARNVADIGKKLKEQLGKPDDETHTLKPALSFLEGLATLPAKYRQGSNRLLLLQTLFANCHNHVSIANSKAILKEFQSTHVMGGILRPAEKFNFNVFRKEFTVIKLLAKRFPTSDVLLETIASLPEIEEPLQLPQTEKLDTEQKSFVDVLLENNKTFHVGSLVKRLWSGLNIPHHNTLPSQQPLGGVSDLTNKGDFHRLLLSEFANEDIVLLSRLANNEALYINREVPPQNNNLERVILVDVSIKNWGTPKTIAFALLLAIAKHPKTDIACSAFAVGDNWQAIHFADTDDIIESLQRLEPSLHSAEGLHRFFSQFRNEWNKELFFISSHETCLQPAMHQVLAEHASFITYWLMTDSKGGIDVYKRQHNSKKHVQHLQLPLAELWKKGPSPETVKPAVKALSFPILFPAAQSHKRVLAASNGELFLITPEKALLRASNPAERYKKGWELVYDNLPFTNGEAEIGLTSKGEYLLLLFKIGDKRLTLLNLTTGESEGTFFQDWSAANRKQFLFWNDQFNYHLHPYSEKYCTITLNRGIQIQWFDVLPETIRVQFEEAEKRNNKLNSASYATRDVLKNINFVFINQVGNLVFNRHELRLTDVGLVRMESTGFLRKEISAIRTNKGFRFPDGSSISMHRSGMLMLESSDAARETIYVPSVLDASLGLATTAYFTGEDYYYRPGASGTRIPTKQFWKEYMEPFIETITSYETQVKAI